MNAAVFVPSWGPPPPAVSSPQQPPPPEPSQQVNGLSNGQAKMQEAPDDWDRMDDDPAKPLDEDTNEKMVVETAAGDKYVTCTFDLIPI